MSRTLGNSRCTIWLLSSCEALSTTIVSNARPETPAGRDCRQARSSAAVFQLTMTMARPGRGGAAPWALAGRSGSVGGVTARLRQQIVIDGRGFVRNHLL